MTVKQTTYSTSGKQSPAANATAITPADADLALSGSEFTRAIYVGTAGNLTVMMAGEGNPIVTFANVPAGSVLPLRVRQIRSTSTTASDIVAIH